MAWRRRWVAAVVLVLVASGCADDTPEPKFEPGAGSPTRPATSAPGPVTKPWEKKTRAGAVAFAKHWVEVFNKATTSGDTHELRRLGSDSCGSCRNFAELIDTIHSSGGSFESRGWRVIQASSIRGLPASQAVVGLRIRQPPEQIKQPGRASVRRDAATVTYSAELGWANDGWIMNHFYFRS